MDIQSLIYGLFSWVAPLDQLFTEVFRFVRDFLFVTIPEEVLIRILELLLLYWIGRKIWQKWIRRMIRPARKTQTAEVQVAEAKPVVSKKKKIISKRTILWIGLGIIIVFLLTQVRY